MAHTLASMIAATFRAAPARKPDPFRRDRAEARALAAVHSIEIEPMRPGFNVWPPKSWRGADPFEGDHYAQDWREVATMVRTYAAGPAAAE